jgi:hypothetical protein
MIYFNGHKTLFHQKLKSESLSSYFKESVGMLAIGLRL